MSERYLTHSNDPGDRIRAEADMSETRIVTGEFSFVKPEWHTLHKPKNDVPLTLPDGTRIASQNAFHQQRETEEVGGKFEEE